MMREKIVKRRAGKVFLIFLCLTVPLSCQKKPDNDLFYTYTQSDPGKLDPFYGTDVIAGKVMAMMFNGLFTIDSEGRLRSDLAEQYSFDGKNLSVTLRSGIRFHNGSPLTPDDVLFSFDRIRRSSNPTSPRKWVFEDIREMALTGDRSLVIRLGRVNATFPYLLTMPNGYIISRDAFLRGGTIIGTGPFRLAEWRHDDAILLRRNSDYFGKKPDIEGVVFKIIPEDLTARFEFMNGTLDYFELPYLSQVRLQRKGMRIIRVPELSVHYIALNTKRPPFDDPSFRRALNMAVDRRRIMRMLFPDRFTAAAGPVPPVVGAFRSGADPIPYDPDGATAIIRTKAPRGTTISFFIKADHQVSLIAQMIQHDLERAGLAIRIHEMEWAALKAATLGGRFDMAYFTWHADYPEAENFLFPLFYSENIGTGGNRSFYASASADALLRKARGTLDDQKRFDIYRRLERLIVNDAPWIFLWYGDRRIALSGRVRAFTPYPLYSGMKGTEISLPGKEESPRETE